jgi:hypothetical protein
LTICARFDGDTVASYRRQLLSPTPENALITGDPRRGATITRRKVEAAARSLGFIPVKSFTMPRRKEDSNLVARTGPELMTEAEAGGPLAL